MAIYHLISITQSNLNHPHFTRIVYYLAMPLLSVQKVFPSAVLDFVYCLVELLLVLCPVCSTLCLFGFAFELFFDALMLGVLLFLNLPESLKTTFSDAYEIKTLLAW